jgi:alanyl-tRNA synthetase
LGDIQLLKITSESAVAAGVRRIEALTGEAARKWLTDREDRLKETAAALKTSPEEVPARVASLLEERRRLERELAEAKKALAMGGGNKAEAAGPEEVGGHGFIGQVLDGLDPKALRGLVDEAKARVGSGVVALVAVNDGRATVAVGVTDDLTSSRNAVDLVRKAVEALGGQGGGGRPDMAQGGGPEGGNAGQALQAVRDALKEPASA